jgi:hypothetical protein
VQISKLNTLVQKETSGDVDGNLLLRTLLPHVLVREVNVLCTLVVAWDPDVLYGGEIGGAELCWGDVDSVIE